MKSGKLVVRIPPALHQRLDDIAHEQGVSLNMLITAVLSGGVHFQLPEPPAPPPRGLPARS